MIPQLTFAAAVGELLPALTAPGSRLFSACFPSGCFSFPVYFSRAFYAALNTHLCKHPQRSYSHGFSTVSPPFLLHHFSSTISSPQDSSPQDSSLQNSFLQNSSPRSKEALPRLALSYIMLPLYTLSYTVLCTGLRTVLRTGLHRVLHTGLCTGLHRVLCTALCTVLRTLLFTGLRTLLNMKLANIKEGMKESMKESMKEGRARS